MTIPGNFCNGQLARTPSLARDGSSVYGLTFEEFQGVLGDPGANLGSMNMDELLRNIWTAEENQAMAKAMDGNSAVPGNQLMSQLSLQKQGSFCLPRTLSTKTVEEVWKSLQQGETEAGNGGVNQQQRQVTLGEITLEDFLVKAGIVKELRPAFDVFANCQKNPNLNDLSKSQMNGNGRATGFAPFMQHPGNSYGPNDNQSAMLGATAGSIHPSSHVVQNLDLQGQQFDPWAGNPYRKQQHPQIPKPVPNMPGSMQPVSVSTSSTYGGNSTAPSLNANGAVAPANLSSTSAVAAAQNLNVNSAMASGLSNTNTAVAPSFNANGNAVAPSINASTAVAPSFNANPGGVLSQAATQRHITPSFGGGANPAPNLNKGGAPPSSWFNTISYGGGIASPVSPKLESPTISSCTGAFAVTASCVNNGQQHGRKRSAECPIEKVIERRQRRMIKNRESAARSRARKQAYTVELEAEVSQLKKENMKLLRMQQEEVERRKRQILAFMPSSIKAGGIKVGGESYSLKRTYTGPW